jgi:hypothetical protein
MPTAVDRATVELNLAEAEQRVSAGLILICHQRGLVAQLERGQQHGAVLEEARSNLKIMMDTQSRLVGDRDRLRADLLESVTVG